MIAFRYTGPTPTTFASLWAGFDRQRASGAPSGASFVIRILPSGQFGYFLRGSSGVYIQGLNGPVVSDGNWHLGFLSYDRATGYVRTGIDLYNYLWSGVDPAVEPTGLVSDNIGTYVDPVVGNAATCNFAGDISFVGEFPVALTITQMQQIYSAWKSACTGESTNNRYNRILRYAGYTGSWWVEGGLTKSMGPASNLDGTDAVSALQGCVDTEGGEHFVDQEGTVTFRTRVTRYNATDPEFTFGEREDLGEYPYEDCQLDFDTTHLSNKVTVTQEFTGQAFYAQDGTSLSRYFPRTMTRTVNSSSADECQDAANYLLSRYKRPASRVSSLTLHPSANPRLWPVCLSLELGTRARIQRRPRQAPALTVDVFVENRSWAFGDDTEATLTLQCSPVDLTPYGMFAAWHTTLNAAVAAGATSVAVKAGKDNTNVLRAQLAPGQQLLLGHGTANVETVTVQDVGASSTGWATATFTLAAATTKSHAANDVVCEVLPTKYAADPTGLDASATFDAVAFAY
jgi:hypothetical protein